jgi:hypothetical protein
LLAVFRKCDVGSIATRVRSKLRDRFIERFLVAAGDGDLSAFGDKKAAVARPMPLLPPVMRAFLPASFMIPP